MTDFTKLASNFQRYFGELQTEPTRSVDKQSLTWFAKTAARAYLNDKVPLNESITKIAQNEKDLNNEHLKRIAEMANNEVFEQLFNNSTDKNVHFDVAKVDDINQKIAGDNQPRYDLSSYKLSPKEKIAGEKTTIRKTSPIMQALHRVTEEDSSKLKPQAKGVNAVRTDFTIENNHDYKQKKEAERKRPLTDDELDGRVRWGRVGGQVGGTLGLVKGVQSGYNYGKKLEAPLTGAFLGGMAGASLGKIMGDATGTSAHTMYSQPVSKSEREDAMYAGEEKAYEKGRGHKKHADSRKDLYEVQEKLVAAKEELETEKLATSYNMKVAYDNLYKAVKSEIREIGFAKVAQAMYAYSPVDSDLNVLEDISYDLMKDRAATIDQLNVNPEKVSRIAVNPEHPVVENYANYTKLAHYKNQIDIAINDVEAGIAKTASALKEMNKRK